MTKEEILEGNKLIAEFMGGLYLRKEDPFEKGLVHEYIKLGVGVFRDQIWDGSQKCSCEERIFELSYDRYWHWLIPVCEKIESITDDFHGRFEVIIYANSCTIQGSKLDTRPDTAHYAYFYQEYAETKIQATYTAVVAFVKWYQNK